MSGLLSFRAAILAAVLAAVFASGCVHTVALREPPDPSAVAALQSFSYDEWSDVLDRFVDERGLVDYDSLRHDRGSLDRFAGWISAVGPTTRPDLFPTREERLAYYLNAYNAIVLVGIVERPELQAVGDAKADFFYFTRYHLDGGVTHLYDLENESIGAGFHEPRVHFALNCASLACPRLPREPFVGSKLDAQLEQGMQEFLSDPRNVAIEDGTLVLSTIFDWYEEDFPPTPAAWIAEHRPQLGLDPGVRVRYRPWDWTLNQR